MKRYIKFIACIAFWGAVGAAFGVAMIFAGGGVREAVVRAAALLEEHAPILLPVFTGIPLVAGWGFYFSARRGLRAVSGEEDEAERAVEKRVQAGLVCSTVCTVTLFFMIGAGFSQKTSSLPVILAEMFVVLLLNIALEARSVHLVKQLQPEKKGDPLQYRFGRDWIGSCDEAEKLLIYKSAYRAFIALKTLFPILTGVLIFARLFFGAGLLPVLTVCICWGVHSLCYSAASWKLSREKIEP